MRVITTIPQGNVREAAAAAKDIEAKGFDGIVTQENKHDAFLPLAAAATVTDRVELATGIAISLCPLPHGSRANVLGPVLQHERPIRPGPGHADQST